MDYWPETSTTDGATILVWMTFSLGTKRKNRIRKKFHINSGSWASVRFFCWPMRLYRQCVRWAFDDGIRLSICCECMSTYGTKVLAFVCAIPLGLTILVQVASRKFERCTEGMRNTRRQKQPTYVSLVVACIRQTRKGLHWKPSSMFLFAFPSNAGS